MGRSVFAVGVVRPVINEIMSTVDAKRGFFALFHVFHPFLIVFSHHTRAVVCLPTAFSIGHGLIKSFFDAEKRAACLCLESFTASRALLWRLVPLLKIEELFFF